MGEEEKEEARALGAQLGGSLDLSRDGWIVHFEGETTRIC